MATQLSLNSSLTRFLDFQSPSLPPEEIAEGVDTLLGTFRFTPQGVESLSEELLDRLRKLPLAEEREGLILRIFLSQFLNPQLSNFINSLPDRGFLLTKLTEIREFALRASDDRDAIKCIFLIFKGVMDPSAFGRLSRTLEKTSDQYIAFVKAATPYVKEVSDPQRRATTLGAIWKIFNFKGDFFVEREAFLFEGCLDPEDRAYLIRALGESTPLSGLKEVIEIATQFFKTFPSRDSGEEKGAIIRAINATCPKDRENIAEFATYLRNHVQDGCARAKVIDALNTIPQKEREELLIPLANALQHINNQKEETDVVGAIKAYPLDERESLIIPTEYLGRVRSGHVRADILRSLKYVHPDERTERLTAKVASRFNETMTTEARKLVINKIKNFPEDRALAILEDRL